MRGRPARPRSRSRPQSQAASPSSGSVAPLARLRLAGRVPWVAPFAGVPCRATIWPPVVARKGGGSAIALLHHAERARELIREPPRRALRARAHPVAPRLQLLLPDATLE